MPTVDSSIGSFFILIISCIVIILTVQKHSSAGSTKALSTLSAHITVVVLFFGPLIFFYMWPFPSTHLDKFLAIFDALLPPFLDPVIYTFRKQEMKVAMRRVCWRLISYRMSLSFFFFFFLLFRAIPMAYGGSQPRGLFWVTAASLHHSHSNTRSELRLWPTPQLKAMLDP